MNADKSGSILEILSDVFWCERLDKVMQDNEEYRKVQEGIDEAVAENKRRCRSEEEYAAIDRLVSAYSASGALYAGAAYQQGMKDCVSLLKEMEFI